MILVLKEAGKWVFFQLLQVLHKEVIKLGLPLFNPGAKLTTVWHVDLEDKRVEESLVRTCEKCWSHLNRLFSIVPLRSDSVLLSRWLFVRWDLYASKTAGQYCCVCMCVCV